LSSFIKKRNIQSGKKDGKTHFLKENEASYIIRDIV